MKLKAFAKINLTLDITGKREDGYHTIESVMQSVSLFDTVSIAKSSVEEIAVFCDKSWLPVNESNTAVKAAEAFYEHTGIPHGVRMSIEKNIPTRAGMGGGSADAAAVLKGMNMLYKTELSEDEMIEIAKKVGADVPFCIVGGTCKCSGIGEKLKPLTPMKACTIVVCKPAVGMSTPRAYAMVDRYPQQKSLSTPRLETALLSKDLRRTAQAVYNRFDEVLHLAPVKSIKKAMLVDGAINSQMTGSGSAVFGIFEDKKRAELCAENMKSHGEVYVLEPVDTGVETIEEI